MIKTENQPAIDTLVEMGYQPDIITLAMAESQNKSLEEVLDLLLFRERHYQKVLRKEKEQGIAPKPKKKYSLDEQPKVFKPAKKSKNVAKYDSESGEDWLDEDLIDSVEPIEVTKIAFGQIPKSVKLGKSKSEITNAQNEEKYEDLPKEMDAEATNHLDKIIQDLKSTNFKDANTYIDLLNKHLATMRNDTNEANKTLQKYIVSTGIFPQILELRNQIFAILSKVLNMRIKKNTTVEIKKLEQVVLNVFEMRLMSSKQLDSTINLFNTFCKRLLYSQDPVFESKLEKYFSDAAKQLPVAWRPAFMIKSEKPQEPEEKVHVDNQDQVEERKVTDLDDIKEAEEHQENADIAQLPEGFDFTKYANTGVVDYCIICMEKTREVVFLPCCHFLTCPLCSPRVMKCPMCNKRIDKHLKIHWS